MPPAIFDKLIDMIHLALGSQVVKTVILDHLVAADDRTREEGPILIGLNIQVLEIAIIDSWFINPKTTRW